MAAVICARQSPGLVASYKNKSLRDLHYLKLGAGVDIRQIRQSLSTGETELIEQDNTEKKETSYTVLSMMCIKIWLQELIDRVPSS